MHFSIPDIQELNEGNGSTFIGYNIHINGVFHCTVRYKQLHNLNEQLKKEFGSNNVPSFPPKKLLPLTGGQLEERRALLEKYVQTIGQDSRIVSSELMIGFLLSAQQETTCEKKQDINLDIYTMNNYQITIRVSTFDRTEQVLTKAFKQINLSLEYLTFFSLYLIKRDNNGEIIILRKLLDFESPYMSHKSIRDENKIVLRKSYWDNSLDVELMKDPIALNLLYVQTVIDVERGLIICPKEVKMQLASFQGRLEKRAYIELASTLKYYGFIHFMPCYCDYPEPQTKVLIAIGDQELSIRLIGQIKEGSFKVTRMRCWRITATHNKSANSSNRTNLNSGLELSFEYLMAKDKLQWITITSDQAILMSVCLQSLVDELLMKKYGIRKRQSSLNKGNWSYMKRDGSRHLICLDNCNKEDDEPRDDDTSNAKYQESFSIKKLQEKFSSVSFKNGREFIENQAFEGIGDEDL